MLKFGEGMLEIPAEESKTETEAAIEQSLGDVEKKLGKEHETETLEDFKERKVAELTTKVAELKETGGGSESQVEEIEGALERFKVVANRLSKFKSGDKQDHKLSISERFDRINDAIDKIV